MDDQRVEWIRDAVYLALDIDDSHVFEDFLSRDNGSAGIIISKFLNETPEDGENAVLFYKETVEEEEEVEVECGAYNNKIVFNFKKYNVITTNYHGNVPTEPSIPEIQQDQDVEDKEPQEKTEDDEQKENEDENDGTKAPAAEDGLFSVLYNI